MIKYDTKAAAEKIGVVPQTLANWRHKRRGPVYYKVGDKIYYRDDDIQEFEEAGRIDPAKR